MDDLGTYAENTWCKGCGNFGILTAFKRAVAKLDERGIPKEHLVITAGIGCHGKIFDYLRLSGLYSIHGRSMATAQGMKIANPALKPVAFAGDGDAFGEGIAHLIFAAKRNADITVIVHDNGVYGLTTGQYTPTSERGFQGPSTPRGSVEEPLNPLALMLEAGATFVARGYSVKLDHLMEIMAMAVQHEGFSFVDVLQPCVSFNNTYERYNELVEILEEVPGTLEDALAASRRTEPLLLGLFREAKKPAFPASLYGDWNPVEQRIARKERRERVAGMLSPGAD
jgi:2-oxoglutarate ferredoxin oxidoreductase subunit beta